MSNVHFLGIPDEQLQALKTAAQALAKDTDERTNSGIDAKLKYSAMTKLEWDDMPVFKDFVDAFMKTFFIDSQINSRAISSVTNHPDRGVLFLGGKDSKQGGRRSTVMKVLIDNIIFELSMSTDMVHVIVDTHSSRLKVSSQAS